MIFAAMHWLMEFRNGRDKFSGGRNPKARGPMLFHPHEEIHKPLAGDIIAQDNDKESKGLDNESLDDGGNNEVHICVSANGC